MWVSVYTPPDSLRMRISGTLDCGFVGVDLPMQERAVGRGVARPGRMDKLRCSPASEKWIKQLENTSPKRHARGNRVAASSIVVEASNTHVFLAVQGPQSEGICSAEEIQP